MASEFDVSAAGSYWARRWPVALALVLPLLSFTLFGNIGLSLQDEGFLWYGAQRVLMGDVPIRDFQAYDIARYYWAAGGMRIMGSDGILSLRLTHAVLAGMSVALAAVLVHPVSGTQTWPTALAIVTFALWMVPYFKVSDSFAVLLLAIGLSTLLRRPTPNACAAFGSCLGFAGTIGINHGLYGSIAGILAAFYVYLHKKDGHPFNFKSFEFFIFGCIVGYAPVIAFHLFVPGFFAAFIDSIRQLSEIGTTNIALPLPRIDAVFASDPSPFLPKLRDSLLGSVFVASGAFLVWCFFILLRPSNSSRVLPPVFVASVIVALPYTHYALSRADTVHVAVSALPILVAVWTYPVRQAFAIHRSALVGVACLGILTFPEQSGNDYWRGRILESLIVRGDSLRVRPEVAAEVRLVQQLTSLNEGRELRFYAAPYWPGAYAVTGAQSPVWEIYPLFPASSERQLRQIEKLIAVDIKLALITVESVDGRGDLGFERTHPLIAQHLRRCMQPLAIQSAVPPRVRVLVASDKPCGAK